jgi:hypothetical protein
MPKVPAEQAKYFTEIERIINSGFLVRKDFKYDILEGKVTTEKHNDRVIKFYPNGTLKEMVYIDESSRKVAIVVFDYHKNKLPGAESEFHPSGELLKRNDIKYQEGVISEETTIDQYGYVIKRTEYSIIRETNTLVERTYGAPQMITEKDVWIYSSIDNGHLTWHEKYDGEHVLRFKRNIIYENGKIKWEQYYNPAGNKAFMLEYTYDAMGFLSLIEKVLPDGTRLKNAVYQYNSLGLITGKISYNRLGKIRSYYKYAYE